MVQRHLVETLRIIDLIDDYETNNKDDGLLSDDIKVNTCEVIKHRIRSLSKETDEVTVTCPCCGIATEFGIWRSIEGDDPIKRLGLYRCDNCRKVVASKTRFCPHCGRPFHANDE